MTVLVDDCNPALPTEALELSVLGVVDAATLEFVAESVLSSVCRFTIAFFRPRPLFGFALACTELELGVALRKYTHKISMVPSGCIHIH